MVDTSGASYTPSLLPNVQLPENRPDRKFDSLNPLGLLLDAITLPGDILYSTAQETVDALAGRGWSWGDFGRQVSEGHGVGKILDSYNVLQGDNPLEWFSSRAIGFLGDVVLDPLTYIGAPGAKALAAGGRKKVVSALSTPTGRRTKAMELLINRGEHVDEATTFLERLRLSATQKDATETLSQRARLSGESIQARREWAVGEQDLFNDIDDFLKQVTIDDRNVMDVLDEGAINIAKAAGGSADPIDPILVNTLLLNQDQVAKGLGVDGLRYRFTLALGERGTVGGYQIMSQAAWSKATSLPRKLVGAMSQNVPFQKYFRSSFSREVTKIINNTSMTPTQRMKKLGALQAGRNDELMYEAMVKSLNDRWDKIITSLPQGVDINRLARVAQMDKAAKEAVTDIPDDLLRQVSDIFAEGRIILIESGIDIGDFRDVFFPWRASELLTDIGTQATDRAMRLGRAIANQREIRPTFLGKEVPVVRTWLSNGWATVDREAGGVLEFLPEHLDGVNFDRYITEVEEIAKAWAEANGKTFVSIFEQDASKVMRRYFHDMLLGLRERAYANNAIRADVALDMDTVTNALNLSRIVDRWRAASKAAAGARAVREGIVDEFDREAAEAEELARGFVDLALLRDKAKESGVDMSEQLRKEYATQVSDSQLMLSKMLQDARELGDERLVDDIAEAKRQLDEYVEGTLGDVVDLGVWRESVLEAFDRALKAPLPDLTKHVDNITKKLRGAAVRATKDKEVDDALRAVDTYVATIPRRLTALTETFDRAVKRSTVNAVKKSAEKELTNQRAFMAQGQQLMEQVKELDRIHGTKYYGSFLDRMTRADRLNVNLVNLLNDAVAEADSLADKTARYLKAKRKYGSKFMKRQELISALDSRIRYAAGRGTTLLNRMPDRTPGEIDLNALVRNRQVQMRAADRDKLLRIIKKGAPVAIRRNLNATDTDGKRVGRGITIHPVGAKGAPNYDQTLVHLPEDVMLRVEGARAHVNRRRAQKIQEGARTKHPNSSIIGVVAGVEVPAGLKYMPQLTYNPMREGIQGRQWLISGHIPIEPRPLRNADDLSPTTYDVPGGVVYTDGSRVHMPRRPDTMRAAVVSDGVPKYKMETVRRVFRSKEAVDTIARRLADVRDGASVMLRRGKDGKVKLEENVFSVSRFDKQGNVFATTIPGTILFVKPGRIGEMKEAVDLLLRNHEDLFQYDNVGFGMWKNPDTNQLELNLSVFTDHTREAEIHRELGESTASGILYPDRYAGEVFTYGHNQYDVVNSFSGWYDVDPKDIERMFPLTKVPRQVANKVLADGGGADLAYDAEEAAKEALLLTDDLMMDLTSEAAAERYYAMLNTRDALEDAQSAALEKMGYKLEEVGDVSFPPNPRDVAMRARNAIDQGSRPRREWRKLAQQSPLVAMRHADEHAKMAFNLAENPKRIEELDALISVEPNAKRIQEMRREKIIRRNAQELLEERRDLRRIAGYDDFTPKEQAMWNDMFAISYNAKVMDAELQRLGLLEKEFLNADENFRALEEQAIEAAALMRRAQEDDRIFKQFTSEAYTNMREWTRGGIYAENDFVDALESMFTLHRPSEIAKGLTQIVSWIRGIALLSPRYHVKNTIGGVISNLMHDVTIGDHVAVVRSLSRYMKGKAPKTEDDNIVKYAIEVYGITNRGQLSSEISQVQRQGLSNWPGAGLIDAENQWKLVAKNREWGGYVEDVLRLAAARSIIKKMPDHYSMSMKMAKGKQLIDAIHFDYTNISQFERHTIRNIIPFWTWLSRNIPVTARLMVHKPQMIASAERLFNEIGSGVPFNPFVPEYYEEQRYQQWSQDTFSNFEFPHMAALRDVDKITSIITGRDGDQGFADRFRGLATDSFIGWRTIIEGMTGRDAYQGYEITGNEMFRRAVGTFVPLYSQVRRLAPFEFLGGSETERHRLQWAWLSFLGVPFVRATDYEQAWGWVRHQARKKDVFEEIEEDRQRQQAQMSVLSNIAHVTGYKSRIEREG